jgi:hypothetical protein
MARRPVTERSRTRRTLIVTVASILAVVIAAGVYLFARREPAAPLPEADVAPAATNSEAAAVSGGDEVAPPRKLRQTASAAAGPPPLSTKDALAGVTPPSASEAEQARDEDYAAQVGDTRPADAAPADSTSQANGNSVD